MAAHRPASVSKASFYTFVILSFFCFLLQIIIVFLSGLQEEF